MPLKTENKAIILDENQKIVANILDNFANILEKKYLNSKIKNIFNKISTKILPKKTSQELLAIYIYGDVGRGKSMLMKSFFNKVKIANNLKHLVHFNSFMNEIHQALKKIRSDSLKTKDELKTATNQILKNYQILCFDEFQVVDIADAMLLSRIFKIIFEKKIALIITSNCHPLQLYKNGLQRELFIDFVNKILLKNCQIVNLDSQIDYREKYIENLQQRYFIKSNIANKTFNDVINHTVNIEHLEPLDIKVWGRKVTIHKTYQDIAIIDFSSFLKEALSANDYKAICKKFSLIFIKNLPKLTKEEPNEARRLILFIDEAYENKLALIILAECEIEEIYLHGIGIEAFKRTISRLKEIKSDFYWHNSKIALKSNL